MVVTLKTGMLRNRYGSSTTQVSSKIFTNASRVVVSHPTEGDVHLPPLPCEKSQPPGFSSLPQHSWVLHEVVLPWGGRKEVSAGVNSPASLSEREQEQFCQTTEQRIHYMAEPTGLLSVTLNTKPGRKPQTSSHILPLPATPLTPPSPGYP